MPRETDPQVLWDIAEIEQLKARYFRLLDTKDWEGLADLFTDDCEHHAPADPPVIRGNDEYIAMLRDTLTEGVTTHHGHMPEITVLGPRDAEGTWSMFDYLQVEPAGGGRLDLAGYGHYIETYRKGDDGRWRISSKRNVRLRVDDDPPSDRSGPT